MALKPSKDRLYNKLMKFRNEIADAAGVVPRGVLTDVVLRRVSDDLPLSESTLLDIPGVSQVFVEKYGKLFLEEIKKDIDGEFELDKLTKVSRDVYVFVARKLSISEIAKKMFLTDAIVAKSITDAIAEGAPIEKDLYIDLKEYAKVKKYMTKNPKAGINTVKKDNKFNMNTNQILIAIAFAVHEINK